MRNSEHDFATTLVVDQRPGEVFEAITNPREWWSENITGDTERAGDQFVFEVEGVHYSRQKLVHVVPDRTVVWLVTDADMTFLEQHDEWVGTRIVCDISEEGGKTKLSFTHEGLVAHRVLLGLHAGMDPVRAAHSASPHHHRTGDPNLERRTIANPLSNTT